MQPLLTQPLHVQTDLADGYDSNNTVITPVEPTGVMHTAHVIITPTQTPPSPIDNRVWTLKSGSKIYTVEQIQQRAARTANFQQKYEAFLKTMRMISDELGQSTPSVILKAMSEKDKLQKKAQGGENPEIDLSSLGGLERTLLSIDKNRIDFDKSNGVVRFIEELTNVSIEHLTSLASQLTIMWEGKPSYNLVLFSMGPYYQFGIKYRLDELYRLEDLIETNSKLASTSKGTEQPSRTEFEPLIDKLATLVKMKEELTCLRYALDNKFITKDFLVVAYKERIKAKYFETFRCIEKELDSSQVLAAANESKSTEKKLVAERIIHRVKEVRNLFADLTLDSTESSSKALSEMEVGYTFKQDWEMHLNLLCKIVELKERLWARSTLKLPKDAQDQEQFSKVVEEATTAGGNLQALQKEITQLINEEKNSFKAIKDPHIEIQTIWDKIFKLERDSKAPEQPGKKTWFGYF